jgi:hypothetical protein
LIENKGNVEGVRLHERSAHRQVAAGKDSGLKDVGLFVFDMGHGAVNAPGHGCRENERSCTQRDELPVQAFHETIPIVWWDKTIPIFAHFPACGGVGRFGVVGSEALYRERRSRSPLQKMLLIQEQH